MAAAAGSLVVAALSLLVVRPAPSYDPWAWLLWGREVAEGTLDTVEGPAFKPLAVAVCAVLAPLGDAAPVLWVLLARAGAVLGVWLAFRLGRRLAGGSLLAGAGAAAGVALCGRYAGYAASGLSEGLLLALALGGAEAWRAGRHRWALACGLACGLLRVETWPFLAAAAVVVWRRRPEDRRLLVAGALALPAAWLLPELIGSGQLLRSAGRARVAGPGQPALADVPALASLGDAVRLPLWPLWAGVALLAIRARRAGAARPALVPAAAGLAWMAVVAAMAQGGFSGEARYALPGAALVAVTGAVGLVTAGAAVPPAGRRRAAALAAAVAVAAAGAPRLADLAGVRRTQASQWALQADLGRAVALAGGRSAVLGCGRPYVGPLRGPLLAYRLHVARRVVEPDDEPRAPGTVFRSRLGDAGPAAPAVPAGFAAVARAGRWEVAAACLAGTDGSPTFLGDADAQEEHERTVRAAGGGARPRLRRRRDRGRRRAAGPAGRAGAHLRRGRRAAHRLPRARHYEAGMRIAVVVS